MDINFTVDMMILKLSNQIQYQIFLLIGIYVDRSCQF